MCCRRSPPFSPSILFSAKWEGFSLGFAGKRFTFSSDSASAADAKTRCESAGGRLAEVDTAAQQEILAYARQEAIRRGNTNTEFFIGEYIDLEHIYAGGGKLV